MEETPEELVGTIIIASIILVIIVVFALLFFLLFIKKRAQLKQQNENLKISFQQELLQTQIEIQEETFAYMSEEIHDNIGQVLSFVKLNLTLQKKLKSNELEEKIKSSQELVSEVIKDLRNLSKSLSYEFIKEFGLAEAIKNELDRINKAQVFEVKLDVTGKEFNFQDQYNLLIFRIFQESLNNIIKHANATEIGVSLKYEMDFLELCIKDNGAGFVLNDDLRKEGAGLKNINKRAKHLGAEVMINTHPNSGCSIILKVPTCLENEKS